MPDTVDGSLNLKQVARHLGVHYMTAYRYVRQGHLAARQVDGGWVVDAGDLAAFERSRATGAGPAGRGDGGDRDGHHGDDAAAGTGRADRLRRHLRAGDEVGAWREVDLALAAGHSPEDVLARLLPEALAGPDRTRRRRVADEPAAHELALDFLATATATRVVDRLGARFARPGRSRGTVLLAAPSGEQHRLPLATVAALVRSGGFRAVDLGADVPPEVIAGAVAVTAPLLAVGIGVTTAAGVDAAARAVALVQEQDPDLVVVVGGQAVGSGEVAEVLGTPWWAPDGPSMVALLRELSAGRASTA